MLFRCSIPFTAEMSSTASFNFSELFLLSLSIPIYSLQRIGPHVSTRCVGLLSGSNFKAFPPKWQSTFLCTFSHLLFLYSSMLFAFYFHLQYFFLWNRKRWAQSVGGRASRREHQIQGSWFGFLPSQPSLPSPPDPEINTSLAWEG